MLILCKKIVKLILKFMFDNLPLSKRNKIIIKYKINRYRRFKYSSMSPKRQMQDELLKQYKQIKLSPVKLEEFEKKLKDLKKGYKKVHIVRPFIMNIGPMCMQYYYLVELLDRLPNNEKVVIMNYDGDRAVYGPDDRVIANKFLYRKINDLSEIIDEKTAPFWGYVIQEEPEFVLCERLYQQYGPPYPYGRIFHTKENIYAQRRYLEYTDAERKYGDSILQEMGLVCQEYYCFFSRNNEYHETYFGDEGTEQAAVTAKRNSDISMLLPAAKKLKGHDVKAVRVGALDSRCLESDYVVDYTNTFRSEFMDFYIMGNAKFFIGDNSGIIYIPLLQQVPVALINNPCLLWYADVRYNFNNSGCFTIFAKWYDKSLNRYLTLKEMLEYYSRFGLDDESEIKLLYDLGIEIHGNSSEEVTDLAVEMNLRIDGKWDETKEMVFLREKYWKLVNEAIQKGDKRLTLLDYEPGSLFLIKNKWWLE